jgi:tetratricopeptide (TPR) repeat protein
MRATHMTARLVTMLTPCAVLAAAGLTLAQPAPATEPKPAAPVAWPAEPWIPALPNAPAFPKPVVPPPRLGIAPMVEQYLFEYEDLAAEVAQQVAHIKAVGVDVKVKTLASLRAQVDKPERQAREIAYERKRGGCGSGSIDSVEEADAAYDCGRRALDRAAWDEALQSFSYVAASKQGPRAVGAYYWRAYAQHRLGQRAEALATLGELKSAYPSSGWAAEANALEVEIRQSTGQRVSPDAAPDEDMKLLALQGLAASDVETAVPMIESVLRGSQSPRVKERALFVLAQSNKPAARDVVVRVAKGGGNPDLQLKAVQYVGMFRTPEGIKVLGEIYGSSPDSAVRKAILRSYMIAGAREPLLLAARQEATPELRLEAVRQLSNLKAGSELADLYARESSPEVKKQILRGLAIVGQSDRLVALAQSESNPELRRTAIRSLGLNRDAATGTLLTQLYAKEQSPDVKDAVVDALFTQNNASALVSLARQEKDPALKLAIVRRLSTMTRMPEAREYLLEILK